MVSGWKGEVLLFSMRRTRSSCWFRVGWVGGRDEGVSCIVFEGIVIRLWMRHVSVGEVGMGVVVFAKSTMRVGALLVAAAAMASVMCLCVFSGLPM